MADKPSQLVLAALGRAAAEPGGLPLQGSKSAPGLFPATAQGRQAAQRCQEEDYLQPVRSETRGKTSIDYYTLTEKGLAYLLDQASPRQLLEDLVRTLEARQTQATELLTAARQMQTTLDGLRTSAERVLRQVSSASVHSPPDQDESWKELILSFLARHHAAGSSEDCPLPEVFRQAREAVPELTIGQFHDGLRQLHADEQIDLHPWTGPLYALPEPPYALLVGHAIYYFARSRRSVAGDPLSAVGCRTPSAGYWSEGEDASLTTDGE